MQFFESRPPKKLTMDCRSRRLGWIGIYEADVLISVKAFRERFVDFREEQKRRELLDAFRQNAGKPAVDSLTALREARYCWSETTLPISWICQQFQERSFKIYRRAVRPIA
jgi:hypothetical protein